jgi:hypothetical protein
MCEPRSSRRGNLEAASLLGKQEIATFAALTRDDIR